MYGRNGANRNFSFGNGYNQSCCTTVADKEPYGWFGAGACRTIDVHQRCVEAQGFSGAMQW